MTSTIADPTTGPEDEVEAEDINDRRTYVAVEVRHLLATDWPPNLAARLGYVSTENLATELRRWGHQDLANRLDKAAWDGNCNNGARTNLAKRMGSLW